MEQAVKNIVQRYYNEDPVQIKFLGGGFYGRVYAAALKQEPFKVVLKIYLYPHLAEKEALQLEILASHAAVKMPKVYFVHDSDDVIPYDILAMEYIDGVNAGNIEPLPEQTKETIADKMVENLISYHQTINPKGFGDIGAKQYDTDWRVHYKKQAHSIFLNAQTMHLQQRLDDFIFKVVCKAYDNYDKIFYLPIEHARLIHGDYNTWNILLNEPMTSVSAVIDPFNCCWADSEMDLYQLNNANGKYYELLDRYKKKIKLSENFELKNGFYEVFTEIMHLYKANKDVNPLTLPPQAENLRKQMMFFGI